MKNSYDFVKEDYDNGFNLNLDDDEENIREEEDEFEKTLANDLQNDCEFIKNQKLDSENMTDQDIEKLDGKNIVLIKNKEIDKLKTYIKELEQEKEDLFVNFKTTTNILLDRIKELETNKTGQRPVTAKIIENLNLKNFPNRNNSDNIRGIGNMNQNNMDNNSNQSIDSNNRCPGCKLIFPQEKFFIHTLDCLRYNKAL